MSEQQTENVPEPLAEQRTLAVRATAERAEELLGKWEQQARMLVALARQQLGNTIAGTHTIGLQSNGQERGADAQPEAPGPEASAEGPRLSPKTVPERAEAIMDEWGQRMGHSTALVGQRLRKMAARAREEAEDMLAEARHLRRSGDGQSHSA